jgi:menaquinone-dependent protoporphyrinogen IX oxidase
LAQKVLVTYTTNAGSTAEVAQAVTEQLRKQGHQVDLFRLEEIDNVRRYAAVIIGAPMIFGWHRAAAQFVRYHEKDLALRKVAYFCTLISLTDVNLDLIQSGPVSLDPRLARLPQNPGRLSLKERYATLPNYLKALIKAAPSVHPLRIGFFGGKLELMRLKWWQVLFTLLIIQAQPGDKRNWEFIQDWAAELGGCL